MGEGECGQCIGGGALRTQRRHEKGGASGALRTQEAAQKVGPNPTDRGKLGTKRHIAVDAKGTPLVVLISGANVNDCKMLEQLVDAIPKVYNGKKGPPRSRPRKLHADKGYDYPFCRKLLTDRSIKIRIARRGVESSQTLGKHRWVVERTHAWMNKFRRLKVRYERRDDIHLAFLTLGCALICWNQFCRLC